MSVAVQADGDVDVWRGPSPRLQLLGLAVAVALHAAAVAALLGVDPRWFLSQDSVVELDVTEPPPPPPELRPDPPPPPPEPEPPPKIVPRRVATAAPVRQAPTPPAPPPPNQEPPPNPSEAPPVFGVTMSSVVGGDSAMAVPVGNTTMTKERKTAEQAPGAYAAEGTRPFTPVSEVYVAVMPRLISDATTDESYPPEAKKMGIEGRVELRLGIDEAGHVKEVKVLKVSPAGYDFEVKAREALQRQLVKFAPARTSDGKAVPFRITYVYRFTLGQ